MKLSRVTKKTEFYIFLTIIFVVLLVEIRSGQFLTGNNLVDLMRSMVIPGMFSIGVFIVLVSGGIDVSFPALAALAMFATTKIFVALDYGGSVLIIYMVGALLGLVLGSINAVLIAKYKFQTLIVTLGTTSIFTGILLGPLKGHQMNIPEPMHAHGKMSLWTAYNEKLNLSSELPITFALFLFILLISFILMKYTMLGRGIYAVGGDEVSAKRAGFNVAGVHFFIYCFVGVLAGLTGVAHASMSLTAIPTDMLGMELMVIAAVVLGGASIMGGKGTLTGTILGIILITIVSNSLILLGIPTYWQKIFLGLIIIVGTGVSAMQSQKQGKSIFKSRKEVKGSA